LNISTNSTSLGYWISLSLFDYTLYSSILASLMKLRQRIWYRKFNK
jgi:hypothetical protein